MSCGTGSGVTHFAGCDCYEAAWAAKLAKAEQATEAARAMRDEVCRDLCTLTELLINEFREYVTPGDSCLPAAISVLRAHKAKLAAAEARAEEATKAFAGYRDEMEQSLDALASRLAEAENPNAVNCDGQPNTPHEPIGIIRWNPCPACVALCRLARAEEALRDAIAHHVDQVECWQDADEPDHVAYHRERADLYRAALAPGEKP